MTRLKGNEAFLCINQCVNIFDIVSCKEQQASELIAWLLDPLESHGLGKVFLPRFLMPFLLILPNVHLFTVGSMKTGKLRRSGEKKKL